jgi:hypothetical protein
VAWNVRSGARANPSIHPRYTWKYQGGITHLGCVNSAFHETLI